MQVKHQRVRSKNTPGSSWLRLAGGLLGWVMVSGAARAQGPPLPLARVQVLRDSIELLLASAPQLDTYAWCALTPWPLPCAPTRPGSR
jgi:hypothetical protein